MMVWSAGCLGLCWIPGKDFVTEQMPDGGTSAKGGCDNCPQRPSKQTVCIFVNVCLVCVS